MFNPSHSALNPIVKLYRVGLPVPLDKYAVVGQVMPDVWQEIIELKWNTRINENRVSRHVREFKAVASDKRATVLNTIYEFVWHYQQGWHKEPAHNKPISAVFRAGYWHIEFADMPKLIVRSRALVARFFAEYIERGSPDYAVLRPGAHDRNR